MTHISVDPKVSDVLSAILDRPEGFTGTDIACITDRRPATIRFVLHRLWVSGWISGGVDAEGNLPQPDKRFYRITPRGHEHITRLIGRAPTRKGPLPEKGSGPKSRT